MSEWLNMGGYAFFVWSSYGIFTVTMVYLLAGSLIRHRAARQAARHRQQSARRQETTQ